MYRSPLFIAVVLAALCCITSAFQTTQSQTPLRRTATPSRSSTQLFFFGKPKDDGSPGDYVCKDCGYVFTKGPAAWAKLPDSYGCPPCGAPKFRFDKVPKGSAKGKKVEVKKSWF
ncbi:hypothetical protein THAOC_35780 [Thalassiosira oceanica]|uniref:Rubredoxin-like domain-containing protein n=1 Tax=Thalassiosira oceanica TaxID=159749 RepID=K0R9K6_THAOC|nr:hypothetical protein THAOC_35780 [Thalassiosira oceanica]|mmetsp:Transcript_27740/g.62632  ORF Transcript_27740/g.62632 Transcript_27740/m.62632 type:complete len:115 (+) Transcript_27740:117-461(+)|eukprot:EJK45601.1 hypothetical protein THAOC_35780 [Thalassiosira oceanica]